MSEHLSVVGAVSEEPESLPTSGEMASPNFPANYPNNLHERKTIKVAKGNVVDIHFTDFQLETGTADYVKVTDGDGTLLGHFGFVLDDDPIRNITSNTETVHILFHTDGSVTRSGWRLEWSK